MWQAWLSRDSSAHDCTRIHGFFGSELQNTKMNFGFKEHLEKGQPTNEQSQPSPYVLDEQFDTQTFTCISSSHSHRKFHIIHTPRVTDSTYYVQEEHAEYVRAMAALAAFMAGFVNIAFVQFGFDTQSISYAVLMGFAITNALTVSLWPIWENLLISTLHEVALSLWAWLLSHDSKALPDFFLRDKLVDLATKYSASKKARQLCTKEAWMMPLNQSANECSWHLFLSFSHLQRSIVLSIWKVVLHLSPS